MRTLMGWLGLMGLPLAAGLGLLWLAGFVFGPGAEAAAAPPAATDLPREFRKAVGIGAEGFCHLIGEARTCGR